MALAMIYGIAAQLGIEAPETNPDLQGYITRRYGKLTAAKAEKLKAELEGVQNGVLEMFYGKEGIEFRPLSDEAKRVQEKLASTP
jgi:hypothetical protein